MFLCFTPRGSILRKGVGDTIPDAVTYCRYICINFVMGILWILSLSAQLQMLIRQCRHSHACMHVQYTPFQGIKCRYVYNKTQIKI